MCVNFSYPSEENKQMEMEMEMEIGIIDRDGWRKPQDDIPNHPNSAEPYFSFHFFFFCLLHCDRNSLQNLVIHERKCCSQSDFPTICA